jgi:hypothetical protein
MRLLHITGVIHPEQASVYYRLPPIRLTERINGEIFVTIFASQITASVKIEKTDIPDTELQYYFQDLLSGFVNMLGFALGFAYDVELISMIDPAQEMHIVFGVDFPKDTRVSGQEELFDSLFLAVQHPLSWYLFHALADVKRSAKSFHDAGFYCYRAIESVMQFFKVFDEENPLKEEKVWEKARETLKVSQEDIMLVKSKADPLRHGKPSPMTIEEHSQIIKITVTVIDKFSRFLAEKNPSPSVSPVQ